MAGIYTFSFQYKVCEPFIYQEKETSQEHSTISVLKALHEKAEYIASQAKLKAEFQEAEFKNLNFVEKKEDKKEEEEGEEYEEEEEEEDGETKEQTDEVEDTEEEEELEETLTVLSRRNLKQQRGGRGR
ncbi:protein ORF50 [Lake sturgeon herpesvirus]|nr:protein ORF50 [Lake sturgeon herpesvirus]